MPSASSRAVARRYDHVWKRFDDHYSDAQPWHFARIGHLLPRERITGRALDAGCGSGRDSAALVRAGCRVTAVDLSHEALRAAVERARRGPRFEVVEADLQALPLPDASFDLVWSYGVLHHLPSPEQGLRELVRVLRPGGTLAVYVYEDLAERTAIERLLLGAVSALRVVTTRLPASVLYRLCQVASPVTFAAFTVPARVLRRWRATAGLAARIPFRYGTSPFAVTGDLYDRFATPIEHRYGRAQVERWLTGAGLAEVTVRYADGWVATARRA